MTSAIATSAAVTTEIESATVSSPCPTLMLGRCSPPYAAATPAVNCSTAPGSSTRRTM